MKEPNSLFGVGIRFGSVFNKIFSTPRPHILDMNAHTELRTADGKPPTTCTMKEDKARTEM